MQRRVLEKHGLPGIVGAIDGSNVQIIGPSESEDSYVNRKAFYSIDMAAIFGAVARLLPRLSCLQGIAYER
ncbi:hypothetical protein Y032_0693g1586 [Ancylostoma ceylanicum]|uniref:DDE Tnp4 domain-containing protein n=1 Tax=Ancylostoma ceylanicum TaxID=53326 RepID=A0A016WGR3_9BILA|nr:hypothetical protein Y032_0693g1586 [Ancylostoma ceylanicum]